MNKKILITGGCGFIGSNLCLFLKKRNYAVYSLDNLSRRGSEYNLKLLKQSKVKNYKIDISNFKKIKLLPKFDLIIDCCAEPAIEMSSKDPDRVINTNLIGTFNILKKCVRDNAKIIFLSTSRVYSIESLRDLIKKQNIKKKIKLKFKINEEFSTFLPKSLYGFTKFCSEELIKEFNFSNNIDYIINRFGVISGPWQFGKQDQGFVSLWVNRYINKKNLSYIGFGGHGNQIRDVIHVDDVCEIIFKQIKKISIIKNKLFNIGGGPENSISLKDLSKICQTTTGNTIKFKKIKFTSIYDIPYYISDNRKVKKFYNWKPKKNIKTLVEDVYDWMISNKQLINKYF